MGGRTPEGQESFLASFQTSDTKGRCSLPTILRENIGECKRSRSYFTFIQSYLFSEYGIGYGWNPQTILISVADFVKVVRTAWALY